MFQSPQWGSNSKEVYRKTMCEVTEFPSPIWGVIIKEKGSELYVYYSFRPRNGEVILKKMEHSNLGRYEASFSPRNGEIVLK